ncbi:MAG: hypothetical protein GF344_09050 [Chitinivibrionales bacterium]|nr:hypothetical protein [Chitinivibrionales bacterium]MBD3357008.1 hypothetical protein [Chitinivibrionales bacterium]
MELMRHQTNSAFVKLCRICAMALVLGTVIPFTAANAETVLVVTQPGKHYEEAVTGLQGELQLELTIDTLIYSADLSVDNLSARIEASKPSLVVLLDNKSIALFRKYQHEVDTTAQMPSIAFMASFVNDELASLQNATGIAYEIPLVTSAVALRSLIEGTCNNIAVIHRERFAPFIEENKRFCARERIKLHSFSISDKTTDFEKELRSKLKAVRKHGDIDGLWILNDNVLLSQKLIQKAWLRELKRMKLPVIVGVEVLVNPEFNFGTFAVLPDHRSLGFQAAELVYTAWDNDWDVSSINVQQPLSVYKVINYKQANKYFKLSKDDIKGVDKILE